MFNDSAMPCLCDGSMKGCLAKEVSVVDLLKLTEGALLSQTESVKSASSKYEDWYKLPQTAAS